MGTSALEVKRASFHTMRMKANPRPPLTRRLPLAALTAMLASCVPPPPASQPSATPPPASQRAAPPPTAQAPAPPAAAPRADWRDAPATPGDWQWRPTATGSVASFAGGQFAMRCERAQGTVALFRAAPGAAAAIALTISTTSGDRVLTARPVSGGVETAVPARDPLLDAMAFSRGRFAVTAAGLPALYVPSWPEVSRVIEDCR